jgi:hypothetical protein
MAKLLLLQSCVLSQRLSNTEPSLESKASEQCIEKQTNNEMDIPVRRIAKNPRDLEEWRWYMSEARRTWPQVSTSKILHGLPIRRIDKQRRIQKDNYPTEA